MTWGGGTRRLDFAEVATATCEGEHVVLVCVFEHLDRQLLRLVEGVVPVHRTLIGCPVTMETGQQRNT